MIFCSAIITVKIKRRSYCVNLAMENQQNVQSNFLKKYRFIIIPALLISLFWAFKLYEEFYHQDLAQWALYPRKVKHILGIFTMPFIHDDYKHLTNNSIPFFILTAGLYYCYKELAFKILFWIYIISGLWVWCAARPAFHMGASAVVYGLASFVFFSGIIRKNTTLLAFSLIVVFLYGSMVWGIFPIQEKISWEGHLFGAVIGGILAVVFRKEGQQRKVYDWELEEENDETMSTTGETPIQIIYKYPKDEKLN